MCGLTVSEEIRLSVERMSDSLRAGLVYEAYDAEDVPQVHAFIGALDMIMLALITGKADADTYDELDALYGEIEEFSASRALD